MLFLRNHIWSYPSSIKSMGSITRLDLSSGSKTFKSFSDNVTDIPQQYGNWGSRYGQEVFTHISLSIP